MQKYEDEIGHYHTFVKLCEEILEVSEEICDRRPVVAPRDETELEELKKNCRGSSRGGTKGGKPSGYPLLRGTGF
jgi:hypothetical protein